MSDIKRPNDKLSAKEKQGKFHYNPGNMSGKEAGIFKEHDAQKQRENDGNDKVANDRHDRRPRQKLEGLS